MQAKTRLLLVTLIFSTQLSAFAEDCREAYREGVTNAKINATVGSVGETIGGLGIPLLLGTPFKNASHLKKVKTAQKIIQESFAGGGPEFDRFLAKVQKKDATITSDFVQERVMFMAHTQAYCGANDHYAHYYQTGSVIGDVRVYLEANFIDDILKAKQDNWAPLAADLPNREKINQELLEDEAAESAPAKGKHP